LNKHKLGAVIAAAMLVLTFAGTAFAGTATWNGVNGWPVANGCNADDTPAGSMLWIYTGDSDSAVKLTVNGVEYTGVQQGQGNGSWHIITPFFATKPSASLVFTGEHTNGTLTISHGCPGETTTTTSDETTTSNETTSSETTSSETTTVETTTDSINTQCIDCTTSTTTTTSSVSINTLCENCTDTTTTSDETTPGGHVEELTPPSTDTIGQATSSSTVSTSLLLVLAGVLATALVVIPAAARKRR
jgi:hypothetical protein